MYRLDLSLDLTVKHAVKSPAPRVRQGTSGASEFYKDPLTLKFHSATTPHPKMPCGLHVRIRESQREPSVVFTPFSGAESERESESE